MRQALIDSENRTLTVSDNNGITTIHYMDGFYSETAFISDNSHSYRSHGVNTLMSSAVLEELPDNEDRPHFLAYRCLFSRISDEEAVSRINRFVSLYSTPEKIES